MNGDFSYEETLMIKAAWYYYMENYTQQNISKLLKISRVRVIRLLEKARQDGVISFHIRQDSDRRMQVEKELITRFGLQDVWVVPVNGQVGDLNESLAQAAPIYISDRLDKNYFINMGYGDTLSRVLNHLARRAETPINVVALTGGVNHYLPNAQSSIFNARLHLIPSPLFLSNPEMVEEIRKEVSVQRIQQMSREAAMTVVGIGSMSEDATIIKNSILTQADVLLLTMKGAVGDLLSHFIDKDGNPVESGLDNRLLSTPLEELKKMNNVIGVAGGRHKAEAIRAALRGKYLDILITDEETAAMLLNASEAS